MRRTVNFRPRKGKVAPQVRPALAARVRFLQAIIEGRWTGRFSYETRTSAPSRVAIYPPQPRGVRLEAQRELSEIYRQHGGARRRSTARWPELEFNPPPELRASAIRQLRTRRAA